MGKTKKPFTPQSEAEIRTNVVKDYELEDNENNKGFIDRLTKERLEVQKEKSELHKQNSKTLRQKLLYKKQALEGIDKKINKLGGKTKVKTKSKYVTKDDLAEMLHRQRYPQLSDEEYSSINALAKTDGKSFEDTMTNNPIAKTYLENAEVAQRVSNATPAPSGRSLPNQKQTEEQKVADELDRSLPPGFKSKADNK